MMKRLIILSLLGFVALAVRAAAQEMNYLERLEYAADEIHAIRDGEAESDEVIKEVKELLPVSEQVNVGQQTLMADNRWLHQLLDEYAKETDTKAQRAKLDEAINRLDLLIDHVSKLVNENANDAGDAKERVRRILSSPQFALKQESELSKKIKEIRQKIRQFFSDLVNRIFTALFGAGQQANWFFRLLVIAGIGLAIFLSARMIARRRRDPARKRAVKRTVLGEEIEEGVTARELAEAAMAAARAGDFRTGVRKLYIALLYELAERKIVDLEPNYTNRDYLARLSSFNSLLPHIRYMTDLFDYCWYGMFQSSEEEFSAYLRSYQEALRQAQMINAGA
ncbi:MAG: DUF4129 domain-containing protein [Acidobacteriota bacterium]